MARIPLPVNLAALTAMAQKIEVMKRYIDAKLPEIDARLKALEERRGPGRPPKQD